MPPRRPSAPKPATELAPETVAQPEPVMRPELAALLAVQTQEVRMLIKDALKAGTLPIPLPKRLLRAWEIVRPEFADLTHGYHPDPNRAAGSADRAEALGYWIQRKAGG